MYKINEFDLARIMARIDKAETGCWLWTGNKHFQIWLSDHKTPARVPRLLYEHFKHKSCDKYQLGFKCGNSRCVNPNHAFLAGKLTNKQSQAGKLRPKPLFHQASKFWANVKITETCWLWTGTIQANGYGLIRLQGKPRLAHAAAYKLFFGDIPQNTELHHTCQCRACVNPAHLKPVSRLEHKQLHKASRESIPKV